MKKDINKLVRDHIPAIIKQNNQIPQIKILNDEDYLHYLKLKLVEEANEVNNSTSKKDLTNELADVLEVLEALINASDVSYDDILKIKELKAKTNGKFDQKIYLIQIDDQDE